MHNQGRYSNRIAQINSQMSALQAADARKRGDVEAGQAIAKGNQRVGAQRVAFGAGGTDVNSGSAANVQASTAAVSQLDALTISHNAHLEAIGYNMQGINGAAQGRFAAIAGKNNEAQSIASGGAKFADSITQGVANYNKYKAIVPVTQPTASVPMSGQDIINTPTPDFGGGTGLILNG